MNQHSGLFNKLIIALFGSWYSIIGHTVLFIVILILSHDLLFFTTFVSIEAIYIGILILMAEYRQEEEKEKKDMSHRESDRKLVKEDVYITQNVMDEIKMLKEYQMNSTKALEEIKMILSTKTQTP